MGDSLFGINHVGDPPLCPQGKKGERILADTLLCVMPLWSPGKVEGHSLVPRIGLESDCDRVLGDWHLPANLPSPVLAPPDDR